MQTRAEMTTTEAARKKGVTRAAVTAAIREGRLPARVDRKPGAARGTWKIARADVEAWQPLTEAADRSRAAAAARWEPGTEDAKARQLAAIDEGFGMFKKGATPTAAFLKERREEADREEARAWRA